MAADPVKLVVLVIYWLIPVFDLELVGAIPLLRDITPYSPTIHVLEMLASLSFLEFLGWLILVLIPGLDVELAMIFGFDIYGDGGA